MPWTPSVQVSCEGDASVSTRKATRKLCMYDLKATLEWEGRPAGEGATTKGEIRVREFASENDEDDWAYESVVKTRGAEADKFQQAANSMRGQVFRVLKQVCDDIVNAKLETCCDLRALTWLVGRH